MEDQNGTPLDLWHPDMVAFDQLPKTVREYLTGMINPPPARNVLMAVRACGASVALEELRGINMQDAMAARV